MLRGNLTSSYELTHFLIKQNTQSTSVNNKICGKKWNGVVTVESGTRVGGQSSESLGNGRSKESRGRVTQSPEHRKAGPKNRNATPGGSNEHGGLTFWTGFNTLDQEKGKSGGGCGR